jgi:hypothetical protein
MSFTWRGVGSLWTSVPQVNQCADTARMARGASARTFSPIARRPCATSSSRSAIIGSPCPTNTAICLLLAIMSYIATW